MEMGIEVSTDELMARIMRISKGAHLVMLEKLSQAERYEWHLIMPNLFCIFKRDRIMRSIMSPCFFSGDKDETIRMAWQLMSSGEEDLIVRSDFSDEYFCMRWSEEGQRWQQPYKVVMGPNKVLQRIRD